MTPVAADSRRAHIPASGLHPHMLITKADGEQEVFDPAKLEHSLALSGASTTMRAKVLAHVLRELKPGGTTEEIYRHAFDILRREEVTPVAARYSIKRAAFALGPSRFPFAPCPAAVFRGLGWKTRTGGAPHGRCALHEVGVLAWTGGKPIGSE